MRQARLAIFLTLIFGSLFFVSAEALAVGETSLTISPLTYDLSANPGDSVVNEFLVRNSAQEAVDVSIESEDFVATGEEGDVNLTTEKTTYSLSSWIQTDTARFTLGAGEERKLKFQINVPYNAEPGGHYASVFAHVSPPIDAAQSGSYVGQKIASLILLRIAGETKEEANIETFQTSKTYYSEGPIIFDTRIKNTGSVHLKPKGVIAITDMFGKKVADIPVEQRNVLPDSIRHIETNWNDAPAFGKFTATLVELYGDGNKQLTAAASFWIIPWKTIAVWGGVIILGLGILFFARKRIGKALKVLVSKT